MTRTLAFNFDGTLNGPDDDYATNILTFHRNLSDKNQVSFYFSGPGNEDDNGPITKWVNGIFGW